MNRTFSVIRRRRNIVEVVTPIVDGISGYRLKWAANFDDSYTTFITSTNVGFRDPAVNPVALTALNTNRQVRIVFDPETYSIPEDAYMWLQLWHVPVGGAEVQKSAGTLILPEGVRNGIIQLQGDAPTGTTVADSLQIDLPRLMQDFRIQNEHATNSLYIATFQGGPEYELKTSIVSPPFGSLLATHSSLWVRGGGSAVPFSLTCTVAIPR